MTVTTRSCNGCTLCCKLLGIDALEKPKAVWCPHCKAGSGCTIYADRPDECRSFDCLYVSGPQLGDHWFPARSKMVVCVNREIGRIEIHVDAGRSGAWRAQPFYDEIKAWSRAAASDDGQILVCLPDRTIVVLPDEDVDLGKLAADDRIVLTRSGSRIEVGRIKAAEIR